jgi:hypothetical protein
MDLYSFTNLNSTIAPATISGVNWIVGETIHGSFLALTDFELDGFEINVWLENGTSYVLKNVKSAGVYEKAGVYQFTADSAQISESLKTSE